MATPSPSSLISLSVSPSLRVSGFSLLAGTAATQAALARAHGGPGGVGGGAHSNSGGMRAERTQTQVKVKPGENILCIQKTLRRTESKQTVVYNQRLYWLGRAKPKVATPGVSSLLPLSPESALNRAGPLTSLLGLAVTASEA